MRSPNLHMRQSLIAAMVDSRPLLDGALPPEECLRPGLHAILAAYVCSFLSIDAN